MLLTFLSFLCFTLVLVTAVEMRIGREFGFGVQRLTSLTNRNEEHEDNVDSASSHVTLSEASSISSCENVSTHYFPAVIDNFAPISLQQVWIGKGQRYWMNDKLWGGPGFPVFVYVGGEWEESCKTLTPGHKYFYDLAVEHQALLLNVEHRFYGDSFPFADMSTANLQYLSALQV